MLELIRKKYPLWEQVGIRTVDQMTFHFGFPNRSGASSLRSLIVIEGGTSILWESPLYGPGEDVLRENILAALNQASERFLELGQVSSSTQCLVKLEEIKANA